jgi:hypothetical protein
MQSKSSLMSGVAFGVLVAFAMGNVAEAKTVKAKAAAASTTEREIDDLRAQIQFLKDRLDEQAAISMQASAQVKQAQAQADAAKTEAAASAQVAQAAATQIQTIPAQVKTQVAANKPAPTWADSTVVSGRMYYNLSSIEQKSNGARVAPSGVGFDVKRFYVGIDHKFNDVYSANVTTDFNYVAADGETQVYIKKAFLQAKYSDALVIQAGATDMPWIPFMENLYGNRYVEQTIVDRLKYGTSSDWGLHAQGKFNKGMFNYDVAVIDGAGYKAPLRSKGVDVEGRFNVNIDKAVFAVGGYTGKLGKSTVGAVTFHTASRFNATAAWVDKNFRLGAEYFDATDWNNVTTAAADKSKGYSLFGTYNFAPKYAVFANYQWVQPSETIKSATKDNYYNIGVSYSPTKIVDIALVYKRDKADNGSVSTGNGTIGGSRDGTYDEFGVFTQLRW